MKRGARNVLQLKLHTDMEQVERAEILFRQGAVRRLFVYPSDEAFLDNDGRISLIWDIADSMQFQSGRVLCDTHVHIKGEWTNPETSIKDFIMMQTLFDMADFDGDDADPDADIVYHDSIEVEVLTQPVKALQGWSAYQLAVHEGFVGTVEEWLESLRGKNGADGAPGRDGVDGAPGKDGAQGEKGDKGDTGEQRPQGISGERGEKRR